MRAPRRHRGQGPRGLREATPMSFPVAYAPAPASSLPGSPAKEQSLKADKPQGSPHPQPHLPEARSTQGTCDNSQAVGHIWTLFPAHDQEQRATVTTPPAQASSPHGRGQGQRFPPSATGHCRDYSLLLPNRGEADDV